MKENEKLYLLKECQKHYLKALAVGLKNPYILADELGRARVLKEVIEKFIDCQPSKYYKAYMVIVSLDKKFRPRCM